MAIKSGARGWPCFVHLRQKARPEPNGITSAVEHSHHKKDLHLRHHY